MLSRLSIMVGLSLLISVMGPGCSSNPAPDETEAGQPQNVTIVEKIHHDVSGIDTPGVYLIRSQQQLDEFGSATLKALRVDFSESSLVVLALGQQPTAGYWARITAIVQMGDSLIVQGLANRPAADQLVAQVLTTPFCAAVIPVTTASEVRSQITSVTGQSPPED